MSNLPTKIRTRRSKLFITKSRQVLNFSKDRNSATSVDNTLHCMTNLSEEKWFFRFTCNFPYFCLFLFVFIACCSVSGHDLEVFYYIFFTSSIRYLHTWKRAPWFFFPQGWTVSPLSLKISSTFAPTKTWAFYKYIIFILNPMLCVCLEFYLDIGLCKYHHADT